MWSTSFNVAGEDNLVDVETDYSYNSLWGSNTNILPSCWAMHNEKNSN